MILTNSYFSGAGLMDLGLSLGGLTVQQSFEIDSKCCATMRTNFDHEVIESDISRKLVEAEKPCDVMVATYPCTKYSTIADIHGTRTGDELFLHFFRHLAIRRPEVYVVENVPGMRKFPVVMEAMTRLPDYYVNVFCPVKSETWLPQRRDRLIILGSRKPFEWRKPEAQRRVTLADIIDLEGEIALGDDAGAGHEVGTGGKMIALEEPACQLIEGALDLREGGVAGEDFTSSPRNRDGDLRLRRRCRTDDEAWA
jgi:DNA (cytosine-5)-methyltransferase 1